MAKGLGQQQEEHSEEPKSKKKKEENARKGITCWMLDGGAPMCL